MLRSEYFDIDSALDAIIEDNDNLFESIKYLLELNQKIGFLSQREFNSLVVLGRRANLIIKKITNKTFRISSS